VSHNRIVLSSLRVASIRPSGLNLEAYSQPPEAGHVVAGQGACRMIIGRVVNKPPYPVKSSMDLSVPYSVGEGDSPKQLGFAVLSHEV